MKSKEKCYEVYQVLFKNGKRYIGITKRTIVKRRSVHYSDAKNGSSYAFHRALRKYNYDVEWSVLYKGMTSQQACDLEIYNIAALDSRVHRNGYNMTAGGEGVADIPPRVVSAETRLKMRNAKLGKKLPKRSKKWRENIGKSKTGKQNGNWGKEPFNKGMKHSDWLTDSGMKSYKKSRLKMQKKVEMMSKDGISIMSFYSVTEATKFIGLKSNSVIPDSIKRKGTSAGYKWRYV